MSEQFKIRTVRILIIPVIMTLSFVMLGCADVSSQSTNGIQQEKQTQQTDDKKTTEKAGETKQNQEQVNQKEKNIMEKSDSEADILKSQQNNAPEDAEKATISKVVDGDTIEVNYNGSTEDVRLLLVDTPETVHPSKPVQPFGPEASEFAKDTLTPGESVKIEFDGPKRDNYDRLLGYIWHDGHNFNKQLLKKGLARYAYAYDPPYTHQEAFQQAEANARNNEIGIWSIKGYVTPDGFASQSSGSEDNATSDSSNSGDLSTVSGYDPNGTDRDCSDFDTQRAAQAFFEAAGGPEKDPHRLDGSDNDGKVCESLP
ncbi:thermonuclease family protein [Lentibacillus salinarum]|uniref:Thermonuclease family protein n=1 Tax=Lentibacillus salinarum TaxID=446820 RepID=A0ABW3ZX61_9BACI